MGKYFYKAYDENFNIIKDLIEEEDIDGAKEKVRAKGLKIIDISKKFEIFELKKLKGSLKEKDLANYCGQVAIILETGVSIIKGLEVISTQVKDKRLKKVVKHVLVGVRRGKPFAASMADTDAFPKLLIDMVVSGELSGNLDTILFDMEEFYNREANIKGRIKNASIYPIILLTVAIGMLIFFNFFIFPSMKDIFKDDSKLPILTKVLLGFMNYFNNNFTECILVLLGAIILIAYIKTINKIKYWLDIIVIRFPAVGEVKLDIITSRFARSMGIFLKSGVPILNVLDSIERLVGNLYISKKIMFAKQEVVNGNPIAESIAMQNIFDPLVIQMIGVGEETGKLEEMMNKLAIIYDKRAEAGITRLMAMVEPMFTLIIGIIVGAIIIAMAMPVMQMSQSMGR